LAIEGRGARDRPAGREGVHRVNFKEHIMRALCGAIITAGALIGLGIAAVGVGTRYGQFQNFDAEGKPKWVYFWNMDSALIAIIILLVATLIVGLGIAVLGLAYHHHRRHLEHLHRIGELPARNRTDVPVS
jgi:hypothetical protein